MELPSHLETLRGLFAPQEAASRPEAKAARELLDRLNSEEAAIETTELASLWREYDGLTWDDDFAELSDQQRARARELAYAIDGFHCRLRVAREATYSAVALSPVEAADAALYRAKSAGRNRVRAGPGETEGETGGEAGSEAGADPP